MALTQVTGDGIAIGAKPTLAFRVEASDTDQSITAAANPVIEWEDVSLDTGSYWDTTNHRYTPSVAGWYLFGGVVRANVPTTNNLMNLMFFKNGSQVARCQFQFSSDIITNSSFPFPTSMIQLNGSGDYVDARIETDENITIHDNATVKSELWGMLVHPT